MKGITVLMTALLTACGAGHRGPIEKTRQPASAGGVADSITASYLREKVTYLASDELEGRGPGTRGDRKAREYLANELKSLGYAPAAGDGRWEQTFPIIGLNSKMPPSWTFRTADGQEAAFSWSTEYMGATGIQETAVVIEDAEVVFVGYGIEAPEEAWDDFRGADLSGKILLMLNDDPDWDETLFAGERKLYYGRWNYKYESAARRGAAGAIIIHTTPSAGYPWQVVQTSWSGVQFEVPAGSEPRVRLQAWLTKEAAARLATLAGQDLDALIKRARSRDFRPVPFGVSTSIQFGVNVEKKETANVAGILPGSDPERSDEVVVFTAHHDHLGIGAPDETGDTIYNGALDNGVAMAQALSVAQAFAALEKPPRRSVLFLFVAAEEQGLLGSKYFAKNPTVPVHKIAANINFELGNVWGRTRDIVIYGKGKSTLEDLLAVHAERQGRVVLSENDPRAGWYYRSDQFSFARVGVPAIWFKSGNDFIERPAGAGEQIYAEWIASRYHQPSDEVEKDWIFDGLVEDARLAFALGFEVADAVEMPRWYPGDEFEAARLKSLGD